MSYESLNDLPHSVQKGLPERAQEIYLDAFNAAWQEYRRPEDRNGMDSREETAHKVAWSEVQRNFEKRDGAWVGKIRTN